MCTDDRLNFIRLASQAAKAEQNGDSTEAALLWSQAAREAKNRDNRVWCEARELRCLHPFTYLVSTRKSSADD